MSYKQETARFLRGIWDKYQLVYFKTPQISLAAMAARDILVNFVTSDSRYLSQIPLENVLLPIIIISLKKLLDSEMLTPAKVRRFGVEDVVRRKEYSFGNRRIQTG